MSKNKKALVVTAATLATTVFLSGCGLFGGEEKKKIDPPQDVTLMEDGEALDENVSTEINEDGKEAGETSIQTELYLIDKNGYVVSQTMGLPKKEGVAQQALEHLVANGPVEQMLPNGFRAVLPADTQMTVNIKDGTATVDFSKEFASYKKEDEKKILQAVTWTLTQFDTVDEVKLQMNGTPLEAMPVGGTPIGEELSRADGINNDNSDVVDITNTKAVTVYYIGGEEGAYYYVPVTKRVSSDVKDNITAIVNELVDGPAYASNLLSDFQSGVKLLDTPKVEDGKITLNFNESIYVSLEEKMVSEHLLNSLVLSLTEQAGVESVALTVNGKADVLTEKGEKLAEPVTRPEKVNTGSF
ncbi:GerMN domain-containing protein [Mesobacillus subterraneus]|uniref:GerMN domain-containing protein n=1 Tax=Mesobacillus subterraneus TaxID=285983 RepID=UPI001CFEBF4C|nr:GerMN domain-containing protein [Mesobacillus subterraneus]WLR56153.1 GerMN domain-containing protein [Mesobacillus subterraneus]